MKRNIFLLALLTLICASSACKRFPIDPNEGKDTADIRPHLLTGTSWQLFGHLDNRSMAPAPIPVREPIILNFKENGLANGKTLANEYSAAWKADDKNIAFSDLVSTKRWVSDSSYENDYYRIMRGAVSYSLTDNGKTLIITDASESLYFHTSNSMPQEDFKKTAQLTDFRVVRFQVDPFHLQTIRKIDESHIAINLQYSGGCTEHDFNVFADKNIQTYETNDVAEMMITHDSHQDVCEAMVTKELIIDVSPLLKYGREYGKSDRLVLNFSQAPYLSTLIEFKR